MKQTREIADELVEKMLDMRDLRNRRYELVYMVERELDRYIAEGKLYLLEDCE